MTFSDWLQSKVAYLIGFYGQGHESTYLTGNEIDMAQEAWDAAMEEAARHIQAVIDHFEERGIYHVERPVLIGVILNLTAGSSPAPREEAPGADSSAPMGPAPGPQPEPE
jgi:hypothetical protein